MKPKEIVCSLDLKDLGYGHTGHLLEHTEHTNEGVTEKTRWELSLMLNWTENTLRGREANVTR